MELSSLLTAEAHSEGAEMRVVDQDGNETDFYITLIGMDSALWRDVLRERQRQMLKSLADDAVIVDSTAESLAKATIGWRGL